MLAKRTKLHTKAGLYQHQALVQVSKVPRHLKICFYLFPPAGCLLVSVTERTTCVVKRMGLVDFPYRGVAGQASGQVVVVPVPEPETQSFPDFSLNLAGQSH